MTKKMTWDQMKNKYPDEWLLIVDFDIDESGHMLAGVVNRHSKSKDEVYQQTVNYKSVAFRYTGESTFSGLRFNFIASRF